MISWLRHYLEHPALAHDSTYNDHCMSYDMMLLEIWSGNSGTADVASWSEWYTHECRRIEQEILIAAGVDRSYAMLFLQAVALVSSQELNALYIARKLNIQTRIVLRWLTLLEDSDVWYRLAPYDSEDEDGPEITPKSKGYIIDTGLLCFLLGIGDCFSVPHHEKWGAIFETWIINALFEAVVYNNLDAYVYHWRTREGRTEVDCIIEYKGKLYPIEIKSRCHVGLGEARGIYEFQLQYHQVMPGVIMHAGTRWSRVSETVFGVPVCR